MTRGRPPRQAIREAKEHALTRGAVVDLPETSRLLFDLMIFCPAYVVFVKVKRTRTYLSDQQDISVHCKQEISQIRAIPQIVVVRRELWVRSPKGTFQVYLIRDDGIAEVVESGALVKGTIPEELLEIPVPAQTGTQAPAPVPYFTCPFLGQIRG